MSRIKTAKESISNRFLTSPDRPYCPSCSYPLYPGEECFECRRIKREDEKTIARWIDAIGGAKAYYNYTKDNFVRTAYNAIALKAAEAYSYKDSSILFHGPRGTGKSHLAAIIKRPLIQAGVNVKTVFISDILSHIRSNIKDGKVLDQAVSGMASAKVLSLEDMGVEKPSEWTCEFYYRVIDGRYRQARHGLIITMNQSLDQLEALWSRFDPNGRVVSRLTEMCRGNVHSLQGEKDWRKG